MTETTTNTDNVLSLVETAQSKGKFNLVDAVKGRGFPEKSVDVYLDANSAFQLEQINEKLKSVTGAEYEELDAVAQELGARIKESKLTFHMRGIGQGEVELAVKSADKLHPSEDENGENPEWVKHYISYLVAKNIYKVTDADGNEDTNEFTVDDMLELRGIMPIDSWAVLVETMQQLTLATSYFDAVTDAGFLQKS